MDHCRRTRSKGRVLTRERQHFHPNTTGVSRLVVCHANALTSYCCHINKQTLDTAGGVYVDADLFDTVAGYQDASDGTEDTSPPTPRASLFSNRDKANGLVSLHASRLRHLLSQADCTRPRVSRGTSWARHLARAPEIAQSVSFDHRPPTSAARTTRRARPPVPFSSGYVLSFRRLALQGRTVPD